MLLVKVYFIAINGLNWVKIYDILGNMGYQRDNRAEKLLRKCTFIFSFTVYAVLSKKKVGVA